MSGTQGCGPPGCWARVKCGSTEGPLGSVTLRPCVCAAHGSPRVGAAKRGLAGPRTAGSMGPWGPEWPRWGAQGGADISSKTQAFSRNGVVSPPLLGVCKRGPRSPGPPRGLPSRAGEGVPWPSCFPWPPEAKGAGGGEWRCLRTARVGASSDSPRGPAPRSDPQFPLLGGAGDLRAEHGWLCWWRSGCPRAAGQLWRTRWPPIRPGL